jgi:hypothetical protein
MSVVVQPSARERFTPRELADAYEDFVLGGEPQYVDAESGLKASAYRLDTGVLLVYKDPEEGVVVLVSPKGVEGVFCEVGECTQLPRSVRRA